VIKTEDPQRPLLRVVNGDATPEEIAAIVAVFSALDSGSEERPQPRSAWADPRWNHRVTQAANFRHGADGWRSSGLPH
jgi:hypothetical protein